MTRDLLTQRLMAVFLSELEEHLAGLSRDLLSFEQTRDTEERALLLDSMFRAAHSLKGAARSVQASTVERICHRLEQHFHDLRAGTQDLSAQLSRALFSEIDALAVEAQVLAPSRPISAPAPPAPSTKTSEQKEAQRPALREQTAERVLRIGADKVDALLARASELTALTSMLEGTLGGFDDLRQKLTASEHAAAEGDLQGYRLQLSTLKQSLEHLEESVERHVRAILVGGERLDDDAQRFRLVPFTVACEGLDRAVHELARTLGKPAELVLEHHGVEVDRAIAQKLRDPLLHLLRNAMSHGIEAPEERARREKPAVAKLVVSAALVGKELEISVRDDGAGFDLEDIRARAVAMRLATDVSERELLRLAFLPGFTTASELSELSGRGVGLDAVKSAVEAIHGSVELSSVAGEGARFALRLPLTLSKLRCLFVVAGGRPYALPAAHVRRVVRFVESELVAVEGRPMLRAPEGLVPLATLESLLGISEVAAPATTGRTALVLMCEERNLALVVRELGGEREVTARALPTRVANTRHVSAATFVSLGRIALVLNPQELCRRAFESPALAPAEAPLPAPAQVRVLIAEDSPTTRAVLKNVLEGAQYEVTTAHDGEQAFMLLQQRDFDILVSDVQMPNKDGFALAAAVRGDARLARLPIVLMTSLENEEDRLRGMRAGASAYLTKSAFDHRTLLETMAALL